MKKFLLALLICAMLPFGVMAEESVFSSDNIELIRLAAAVNMAYNGESSPEAAANMLAMYINNFCYDHDAAFTRDEMSAIYSSLFAAGSFEDAEAYLGDFCVIEGDSFTFEFGDGEAYTEIAVNEVVESGTDISVECSAWYDVHGAYEEFRMNAVAELVADESALFGAKLVSFTKENELPAFDSAESDAQLEDQSGNNYKPINAIDGDNATCWAYTGSDTMPTLTISADECTPVRGIAITGGYAKNEDIFAKNDRIKQINVVLSDGFEKTFDLDEVEFFDGMRVLAFASLHYVDSIEITVTDVYPGSKYDDVCVSEILVF